MSEPLYFRLDASATRIVALVSRNYAALPDPDAGEMLEELFRLFDMVAEVEALEERARPRTWRERRRLRRAAGLRQRISAMLQRVRAA